MTIGRLLIAAAIVAVVAVVALVARRRHHDAPTQVTRMVPSQLDRADFDRPDTAWLVAIFTSTTCGSCADVVAAAREVAGSDTAVGEVEYQARRALHERYGIEAVPTLVLADRRGAVRASFVGPVTAADLVAAFASARSPSA